MITLNSWGIYFCIEISRMITLKSWALSYFPWHSTKTSQPSFQSDQFSDHLSTKNLTKQNLICHCPNVLANSQPNKKNNTCLSRSPTSPRWRKMTTRDSSCLHQLQVLKYEDLHRNNANPLKLARLHDSCRSLADNLMMLEGYPAKFAYVVCLS